jgi:hypothetical protein
MKNNYDDEDHDEDRSEDEREDLNNLKSNKELGIYY